MIDETKAWKRTNLRNILMYWLFYFSPAIVDKGNAIVWRGYADDDDTFWARVRIEKRRDCFVDGKFNPYSIAVDSNEPLMKEWMENHKTYLKGQLIWYCKAVWDAIYEGILDANDYDRTEDEVDFGEDIEEDEEREPKAGTDAWYAWKCEKEQEAKEYAEAMRYRDYCESKYGWDCS